jgi:hypothetical protein
MAGILAATSIIFGAAARGHEPNGDTQRRTDI